MSRIIIAASASAGEPRTVLLRLLPIILGAGVLCLSLPSYGQDGVPALGGFWRQEAFRLRPPYMQLGQLTGSRISRSDQIVDERAPDEVIDGYNNPILKPWITEIIMQKKHFQENDRVYPIANSSCWPFGVPGVYGIRQIQILQMPDEITILYQSDQQSRHIYLNDPHTTPLARSWFGESVGHFEGDTLVVDTFGFHNRPEAMVDDYGTPVSDALHVVERYRVLEEGRHLQVHITVEDPNTFRKPWSTTVDFSADDTMLEETRCAENNRDFPELMPIAETPDF